MVENEIQNAYFKIANQFNVPVALYDLEKELKRIDKNYSIVDLIDKLLDWATKKKIYQINNEYYTHIRIKRNLIR